MPKLIVLVGPPGSGKSTMAKSAYPDYTYINQDSQGKEGHYRSFCLALNTNLTGSGENIVVDRMNFDKAQRARYLADAKIHGYETEIHVLHESKATCFERCFTRQGHKTVKTAEDANNALDLFFRNYERVEDNEADRVVRIWPEGDKPWAIYSDLDGTLCNCSHRIHHVRTEGKKKNWTAFMNGIKDDLVNRPVMDVLNKFKDSHQIVYCSGRSTDVKQATIEWLHKYSAPSGPLFVRNAGRFATRCYH